MRISVIPAKAGIQGIHTVTISLDPGFRRGDDFLRDRHLYVPQRLYEVAVAAGAKDFAGLVDRLGGVQGELAGASLAAERVKDYKPGKG